MLILTWNSHAGTQARNHEENSSFVNFFYYKYYVCVCVCIKVPFECHYVIIYIISLLLN